VGGGGEEDAVVGGGRGRRRHGGLEGFGVLGKRGEVRSAQLS
jgi:hypothetical protein